MIRREYLRKLSVRWDREVGLRLASDFTRITSSAPPLRGAPRNPGIPRKHSTLAFPFAALCAATGTLLARHRVLSLARPLRSLARSLAQVADDRRADTCARVGACVPHVTKTRRVGPAYIRPAALEMESVFDMLRPLHFVSGPHSTLASSTSILSSQRRFSFRLFYFLCLPASASRVHVLSLSLSRRHETSIASPINLSD